MLAQTDAVIGSVSALVAVMGCVFGWLRWIRPRLRKWISRIVATIDTIAGREPIVDSITHAELSPALPSLGLRLASVEGSVSRLVEVIEGQHKQDERLDDHERRLNQLEDGAIERIAGKAESVAMWRGVEAIAKQGADEAPELD